MRLVNICKEMTLIKKFLGDMMAVLAMDGCDCKPPSGGEPGGGRGRPPT